MRLFRYPFTAMGSPCELQLYATHAGQVGAVADLAIAEAIRLESRYSRYRADSWLSQINQVAAAGGSIAVDEETTSLLNYAQTCYEQSDGLFDITSGLLREAWDFKSGRLPLQTQIEVLLARIGWHQLRWQAPRLSFPPGMQLDFGGIVKEYAADRLASLCWNARCRHGFINLGGDIRVLGPHPDGSPWRIGVKHPRSESADPLRIIELTQGGIASSGDYERGIEINGTRYGHILNPKTGWPVQYLAAVTVVADLCVLAGSAATIGMLKEQAGPEWLANLGLDYVWVDTAGGTGGTIE